MCLGIQFSYRKNVHFLWFYTSVFIHGLKVFFCFCLVFETGSYCVSLANLELRLCWHELRNSEIHFASFFFFFFFLVFRDRVSLCSPGCPRIHSVDQAGHKLRNPPDSLPSAGIKGVHHHASLNGFLFLYYFFIFIKIKLMVTKYISFLYVSYFHRN
jgi:hypothetical protein